MIHQYLAQANVEPVNKKQTAFHLKKVVTIKENFYTCKHSKQCPWNTTPTDTLTLELSINDFKCAKYTVPLHRVAK